MTGYKKTEGIALAQVPDINSKKGHRIKDVGQLYEDENGDLSVLAYNEECAILACNHLDMPVFLKVKK